jgi:hypothetical protein
MVAVHHYEEEGMSFKVTFTLRARKVEEWIRVIQEKLLDNALIMCVGLDVEYTDVVPYVKQRNFPLEQRKRATVLQLSIAYETLVKGNFPMKYLLVFVNNILRINHVSKCFR